MFPSVLIYKYYKSEIPFLVHRPFFQKHIFKSYTNVVKFCLEFTDYSQTLTKLGHLICPKLSAVLDREDLLSLELRA